MKCTLCDKSINNYSAEFNHLEIDKIHSVDFCAGCIEKIMKWQQTKIAKLFPTKIIKKVFDKK